jgi:hypothetical protein
MISIAARSDLWGLYGEILVDNPQICHRGGYNHFVHSEFSIAEEDGDAIKLANDLIEKSIELYREYHDNLISNLTNTLRK